MSLNIRTQPGATVATPPAGHVQFFIAQDGTPCLKDSDGVIISLTASANGTAGGDLSGTYPNPSVVSAPALKTTGASVNVSAAAPPTVGQLLTAVNATTATWQDPPSASPSGVAGGDLSGSYPNPTVDRANGLRTATTTVSVASATAPTVGQILTATSNSAATWQDPPTPSPTGPAGGDLSGTYPNPSVVASASLRTLTTEVSTELATAPTAGQALIATSNATATWQSPSGDLGGTWSAPTVVQARGLKSATTTIDVASAAAPTAGQILTATSGTAATWQTYSIYTRNSVWDPPLSADAADEEFTEDPFLGGSWTVRDSGGTVHTREGDVDPKTYPAANMYRSTCLGSTVFFQTYRPITVYLYKAVPSPTAGTQLWMAGFDQVASLTSSAHGSTITMFNAADDGGLPDFTDNIVQVGLKNVDGTGVSSDFWTNVVDGGVSTDGFTFSDASMGVSGMPGFLMRRGASLLSGSNANTVNFGMFSPYGALSTGPTSAPYSSSFTGSWAWCGFRITTDNNAGSAMQGWGQIFALHFIRRKLAANSYIFG